MMDSSSTSYSLTKEPKKIEKENEEEDDDDFSVRVRRSAGRRMRTRSSSNRRNKNESSEDEEDMKEEEDVNVRRSGRLKTKPKQFYGGINDDFQEPRSTTKRVRRSESLQKSRNWEASASETETDESEKIEVRRSGRVVQKPVNYLDVTADEDSDENQKTMGKLARKEVDDDKDFGVMSPSAESESLTDDSVNVPRTKKGFYVRSKSSAKRKRKAGARDDHQDYCRVCKDGGKLLCCSSCPWVYHLECLNPPLMEFPKGKWACPRCSAESIEGKVDRILAWRWIESKTQRDAYWNADAKQRRMLTRPRREFFVHLEGKSYWKCLWVGEDQMKVFHTTMLRKYLQNEELEEVPATEVEDCTVEEFDNDSSILSLKFFRFGVKPEWLQVQRIINARESGSCHYLVKWKGLGYDQLSWEKDSAKIPGFKEAVEVYQDRRAWFEGRPKEEIRGMLLPPQQPVTDLTKKYDCQPSFIDSEKGLALHSYQLDGLNWLRFSWSNGTNTILADEMGLGKTIQAITFLNSLYIEGHCKGPFLIAAPLSTLLNWEREFELWAPAMYVVTYAGDRNTRKNIRENELSFEEDAVRGGLIAGRLRGTVKFDVLLTSYELVSKDKGCLSSIGWAAIVVDEAHRIKNDFSLFYRCLSSYSAQYKLLLTGTPLQNNLEELFYLLHFLSPNKFEDLEDFQREFTDVSKEDQVRKLHEMLAPHMLRRLKVDVLKDLPSKSEIIVRVGLAPMQREYYRHILTKNLAALNGRAGNKTSLLYILMDLRKCCNHPYLFSSAAEKAPMTSDGLYELRSLVKASGKLILLEKMLKHLKENGHRVLIFSQMTRLLDILEDFLTGLDYPYERLDGSVGGSLRQEAIDRFNKPGAEEFVFLLSTKAGGLGINLASADTVIIYDSDWNPHNDIQAFSRAHRIGQKNEVMIYRFVTKDSVEERIIQVANRKMMLTHLVVRPEQGPSLTSHELQDVIKFGSKDLFKEESDETANNYSDENIAQLLDRSNKGVEQKESWFNDYLNSFKVASFVTEDEKIGEHPSEIKNSDVSMLCGEAEKENSDPNYWNKLLKPHLGKEQERFEKSYGRGKRRRNEVKYALAIESEDESQENRKADPDFPSAVVEEQSDDDDDDDDKDKEDDVKIESVVQVALLHMKEKACTSAANIQDGEV